MELKTNLFINGAWVKGDGLLPVYNPSTGEEITQISTAGDAECLAAVEAAHRAQAGWAKTAPRVR